MGGEAWLDISIFQCPECGRYYADAAWYAIELESDIECGSCHKVFNAKKHAKDRVMLKFEIGEEGKAIGVGITEHIKE
jgi:uncharacterized protein (UPF0212 family)